jgi:hypothetical protein
MVAERVRTLNHHRTQHMIHASMLVTIPVMALIGFLQKVTRAPFRPVTRGHAKPDAPGFQHTASNNPLCSEEAESRIEDAAEVEKHVHGCLTDEASLMAKDGATITPAHDSGVKSLIKERDLEL